MRLRVAKARRMRMMRKWRFIKGSVWGELIGWAGDVEKVSWLWCEGVWWDWICRWGIGHIVFLAWGRG